MRLPRQVLGSRSYLGIQHVARSTCFRRAVQTTAPRSSTVARKPIDLPSLNPTSTTPDIQEISYEPLPRSLAFRRAILLLHLPVPPKHWPARVEMESELLAATTVFLKGAEIAVNVVYDGSGESTGIPRGNEVYPAKLYFGDGKVFTYDRFSKETLESLEFKRDVAYRPEGAALIPGMQGGVVRNRNLDLNGQVEIYVCTHGNRDCRCADRGVPLVEALRREVESKGLHDKVRIGEIAHVGGHKYAANALVFPSLDMFSNLATSHAERLVSHAISEREELWENWRGRFGLSEEDQLKLWETVDPSRIPRSQAQTDSTQSQDAGAAAEEVLLRFKTWEGVVREVQAKIGQTLLEVGKANDLPSLEGTCGGNLECATCHLYLPESPPPPVEESSDEEFDMLGYAVGYRDGESRLGCQIRVTQALGKWIQDGGVIGLPRF